MHGQIHKEVTLARELKYPVKMALRISDETNKQLVKQAKRRKVKPAVVARILVEEGLER